MAITTYAELEAALRQRGVQRSTINKNGVSNGASGQLASRWINTGLPTAGSAPGAAAIPTNVTTGAMTFGGLNLINATAPAKNYIALVEFNHGMSTVSGADRGYHFLVDRVGHMGGLSGTSTGSQSVALDISGLSAARKGLSNLSEIEWFIEVYTDLGSTPANATVNVTYTDASSENIVVAIGATERQQRLLPIIPATAGKFIQVVNNITLSVSTTAVGNFGVTAYRRLANAITRYERLTNVNNYAQLGLPVVPADACLQLVTRCTANNPTLICGQVVIVTG